MLFTGYASSDCSANMHLYLPFSSPAMGPAGGNLYLYLQYTYFQPAARPERSPRGRASCCVGEPIGAYRHYHSPTPLYHTTTCVGGSGLVSAPRGWGVCNDVTASSTTTITIVYIYIVYYVLPRYNLYRTGTN